VFAAVGRLADFGIDFGLLLSGLADTLRAQLAIALGGSVPDLSDHMKAALESRKSQFASGDLLRMLTMLVELEPHFRRSGQQQLLFETLLVRFALLDRTVNLEDILKGIDGGGGGHARIAETAAPSKAPPAAPRVVKAVANAPEVKPPVVADVAPAPKKKSPVDLNRVAEHWDDIVEHVRASGRGMVASALAEATPTAVTGAGVVTISVSSDALADALTNGSEQILAALRSVFDGVERLSVQGAAEGQPAGRSRLTAENVIADRVATLRKRDPLLNAAIDALDLRLIE
jgi:DNA polymerase-3 subunit gamma/tau